jgi:hypothetical protein
MRMKPHSLFEVRNYTEVTYKKIVDRRQCKPNNREWQEESKFKRCGRS